MHATCSTDMNPFAASGTCLTVVGTNLVVVGTSSGVAQLFDLRVPMKASSGGGGGVLVWSVQRNNQPDPITAITSLWQPGGTAVGHEFLTATLGGQVIVHDIRFRMEVQSHLLQPSGRGSDTISNGRPAILSMCNDAVQQQGAPSAAAGGAHGKGGGGQASNTASQPLVYVGTHIGEVRCLNIATGAETMILKSRSSSAAATGAATSRHVDPMSLSQSSSGSRGALLLQTHFSGTVRCLVKPLRTPLVVSAGNDSVIRLWNTHNPAASARLCISTADCKVLSTGTW